jgi:hypothetical protein
MKKYIINFIAGKLFKLVTEDEFLRVDPKTGNVHYRGTVLTKQSVESLAHEAKNIKSSELYKVMLNEMTFIANKKMFFDSTSETDILAGKMILWTLDVLSRKIDNISRLGK